MLTGKRPFEMGFEAQTPPEKRKEWFKQQHEQTPAPTLPPQFPKRVNQLIQTCLSKRPEERFATVYELLQELFIVYEQQFRELPQVIEASEEFTGQSEKVAHIALSVPPSPLSQPFGRLRAGSWERGSRRPELGLSLSRSVPPNPPLAPRDEGSGEGGWGGEGRFSRSGCASFSVWPLISNL